MGAQDINSCGLGGWQPKFLQRFATTRTFIFVYGLLGTVQAMSFVYFVATLTTLEKRFQIPSQTTGILMSGNEISQILLAVLLGYKGGRGNRPMWIAWGVLFSSLSCFILAVPHWIYGAGDHALALTEEYLDPTILNATSSLKKDSNPFTCSETRDREADSNCPGEIKVGSIAPLLLIFFSQFVLGIGTSLYMTLGQSYLDDNSKKKNTPKLLGITMALRTIGPAIGFIIGFACLSLYIDPSLTPVIQRRDPRWLGAWWLGWVILGSAMTIFSFLMALFPKELVKNQTSAPVKTEIEPMYSEIAAEKETNGLYKEYYENEILPTKEQVKSEMVSLKHEAEIPKKEKSVVKETFFTAFKRVVRNPLLMANNLTAVFYILGVSGYIHFYNKYTETQFHQSAAAASMIAGVTTVASMTFGFLASGFFISRFKPRTSYLLAWNIGIGLTYMAGEFALMFIGCEDNTLQGNMTDIGILNPNSYCNANCSCESVRYSPVCYEAGNQTFFSACHAGCTEMIKIKGKRIYGNCNCLPDLTQVIREGPCQIDCQTSFYLFMFVQCFIQFVGCSGRITTVLVNYRSVEKKDKSIAQGLALFMISLLAFIPGPIIYGRIIDSTCKIWDDKCGQRGNCWLYDKYSFRMYINTAAALFTFGALILDFVVWYLGRNIDLYEEGGGKNYNKKT